MDEVEIPVGATIVSAKLSIYRSHEPQCNLNFNFGPDHYDQDGVIICEESTLDWSENSETYNSLFPKVSGANKSNSGDTWEHTESTVGWMDFDVSDAVKGMISNPSNNRGFNFRAEIEGANASSQGVIGNTSNFREPGKSGILGSYVSANNSDQSKSPKLEMEYSGVGILSEALASRTTLKAFYDSRGSLQISIPESGEHRMTLVTMQGRTVIEESSYMVRGISSLTTGKLSSGVYLLTLRSGEIVQRCKLRVH